MNPYTRLFDILDSRNTSAGKWFATVLLIAALTIVSVVALIGVTVTAFQISTLTGVSFIAVALIGAYWAVTR
jgi:hypothetical protein